MEPPPTCNVVDDPSPKQFEKYVKDWSLQLVFTNQSSSSQPNHVTRESIPGPGLPTSNGFQPKSDGLQSNSAPQHDGLLHPAWHFSLTVKDPSTVQLNDP